MTSSGCANFGALGITFHSQARAVARVGAQKVAGAATAAGDHLPISCCHALHTLSPCARRLQHVSPRGVHAHAGYERRDGRAASVWAAARRRHTSAFHPAPWCPAVTLRAAPMHGPRTHVHDGVGVSVVDQDQIARRSGRNHGAAAGAEGNARVSGHEHTCTTVPSKRFAAAVAWRNERLPSTADL